MAQRPVQSAGFPRLVPRLRKTGEAQREGAKTLTRRHRTSGSAQFGGRGRHRVRRCPGSSRYADAPRTRERRGGATALNHHPRQGCATTIDHGLNAARPSPATGSIGVRAGLCGPANPHPMDETGRDLGLRADGNGKAAGPTADSGSLGPSRHDDETWRSSHFRFSTSGGRFRETRSETDFVERPSRRGRHRPDATAFSGRPRL